MKTDVIIIGGGATGCGIARDLALRGIPHYLLEEGDFARGATGACHGLLHSGARYVVTDAEAARECIEENKILRRIGKKCIQQTGGLFVRLPGDSKRYRDKFLPRKFCPR
jgi:glycerol-3-phosphate dehydrogenase